MATALDSIIDGVREDLALRKTKPNDFDEKIAQLGAPISPFEYLRKDAISVISEIKRSSPSKGELAKIADPQELALKYIEGGASAISVLTEERRFKGSIVDFMKVREVAKIPMLRKDFIVDAPTYSQAFRFFREKGIYFEIVTIEVNKEYENHFQGFFTKGYITYEEAELACLKKLIELVKNK